MKKIVMIFILMSLSIFSMDFEKEKKIIKSQWYQLTQSKYELKTENLIVFGLGFSAGLAGDEFVRNKIRSDGYNGTAKKVSALISDGGMGLSILPIGGYILGKMSDDNKMSNASFLSGESLVVSIGITTVLKYLIGRDRPDVSENALTFKPFTSAFNEPWDSFPSGHATIAWAVITPYAECYNNKWLYAIPAAVSIARVYDEKHWTSDVILGSGIGFAIGYTLSKWNSDDVAFDGEKVIIKF